MHTAVPRTLALLLATLLFPAGCGVDENINPVAVDFPGDGGADSAAGDTGVVPEDGAPAEGASGDERFEAGTDASQESGVEAGADGAADAGEPYDAYDSAESLADTAESGESGFEAGDSGADVPGDDAEAGGWADAGDALDSEAGPGATVRVVAANLTSGNYQSYDPGEGIRILRGLKADVVLLQEFNYGSNSPAELQSLVDGAMGPGSHHVRGAGQIPNGVLSRYPILQSGEWDDPFVSNRDFTWARLDVPGERELWAVSVHFLTSSVTDRDKEAQSLVAYVSAQVPSDDYLVLGGDFNTGVRTESCLGTLSAHFWTDGPWPADQDENGNTNRARSKPYDWVVANAWLQARHVPVVIGANHFADGLVFDSRVYAPLSDVQPVLSSDSDAVNMQHMAVVRAFHLP